MHVPNSPKISSPTKPRKKQVHYFLTLSSFFSLLRIIIFWILLVNFFFSFLTHTWHIYIYRERERERVFELELVCVWNSFLETWILTQAPGPQKNFILYKYAVVWNFFNYYILLSIINVSNTKKITINLTNYITFLFLFLFLFWTLLPPFNSFDLPIVSVSKCSRCT